MSVPAFLPASHLPALANASPSSQRGPTMQSASRRRSAVLADATKLAVCTAVGLTVLRWRLRAATIAAGALLNSGIGKGLKRVLRIPRPAGAGKADPGMPSSHATSLSFLSVAAARSVARSGVFSPTVGAASGMMLVIGAIVATAWRVRCGYHTTPQVVVGWMLGAMNWIAWEKVVEPRIEGVVESVQGSAVEGVIVGTVLFLGVIAFFGGEARDMWRRRRQS